MERRDVMFITFATAGLAVSLIWLSFYDTRHFRLPDIGTLPLIGAGVAANLNTGGVRGLSSSVLGGAIGFLIFWSVALLYHRWRGQRGLGLGDAKLLAAAGAWLGPLYLAPTVLIGAILALGFVLLLRTTGRKISSETRIPFGPFLSASFFILWCMHVAALV
jgi:leader peptidase (prepilin peptidase)/N-methyltransferase